MIERLFLDRIHGNGRRPAVAKLRETPTFILADEAETSLAFADVTMSRAEIAVQPTVGHCFPPTGFVNKRLLCCERHDWLLLFYC
jgi:hypothetical protein